MCIVGRRPFTTINLMLCYVMLQMASKDDHRSHDTLEAGDAGSSLLPSDSRFSTDKQAPVPPSSHVKVMHHKPSAPGLSSRKATDTQQDPLSSNPFPTLEHVEEAHQKQMTSRHEEETHIKSLRPESSLTTGHCDETCQKSWDSFASADETNPKTFLVVSHSIIPNASDDSNDESLKKPKNNTHAMLSNRQNLEQHAGTLIDIYNDIHSKELISTNSSYYVHGFPLVLNINMTMRILLLILFLTLFSINNLTNNSVLVN